MFNGIRAFFNRLSSDRRFIAARQNRLESDWILDWAKTNDELKQNLYKLVLRSRDLSKNNSDYIKWLAMREINVVGSKGITLMLKVKNPDGGDDSFANKVIEDHWWRWGMKRNRFCVHDGSMDWRELCSFVDMCLARDGECFVRMIRGAENPYLFSLQVIDSLDIDMNYNIESYQGTHIVMGIEFDEKDRPTAYHRIITRPGTDFSKRERIPASDIIHVFRTRFAGQVRGYPIAVGAILDLNMAQNYKETSLVGARAAAAQMGIWEPDCKSPGAINPTAKSNDDGPPEMDVQPGRIIKGKLGWKFTQFTPTQPIAGFAPFLKAIYRSIANGLLVAYNYFANDLEGVNFSSLRAGTLAERDSWKIDQQVLICSFVEPIFAEWLKYFLLSGQSKLPFIKYSKFLADSWQPRRWEWVDPSKDVTSKQLQLICGMTSLHRVFAETGDDYDEIKAEREQEIKDGMLNLTIQSQNVIGNEYDKKDDQDE